MAGQPRARSTSQVEVIVGNVIRRWVRAVRQNPAEVIILSPYVTGAADTVLTHATLPARLYTVFTSDNFAKGSSKLSTLKKLVQAGHQVFHLERLHAKVVLTKSIATVGSQNLTTGGTHNREITVLLRNPKDVATLRHGLEQWLKDARPVTPEQILDVERQLVALRKALKTFSQLSKKVDADTAQRHEQRERERQEAEERRIEAERKRAEEERKRAEEEEKRKQVEEERRQAEEAQRAEAEARRQRMQSLLTETECSAEIPMRLSKHPYETLVRRRGRDSLTVWPMANGRDARLAYRHRYLLVMQDSGRVSWPALNHTRLTQFGSRVDDVEITLNGLTIFLNFKSLLEDESEIGNIEIKFRLQLEDPPVIVPAWFHIEGITLYEPVVSSVKNNSGFRTSWLLGRIKNENEELKLILIERLLRGFKYRRNSFGCTASEFFGDTRQYVKIRLHILGQSRFLVAS